MRRTDRDLEATWVDGSSHPHTLFILDGQMGLWPILREIPAMDWRLWACGLLRHCSRAFMITVDTSRSGKR